jgi:alcohol dehydrogenase class IV
MRTITLHQPERLVFGSGCLAECGEHLRATTRGTALIVTSPSNRRHAEALAERLPGAYIDDSIRAEPTVSMFRALLDRAKRIIPEVVVGVGGGSPLDAAKLVAALARSEQGIEEVFGIGKLQGRTTRLICLPTTAGTGSEVSPNAILLDESERLKKGAISPFLVPDEAWIDPALACTVPTAITAATGLDALTHCIEAYANTFAHPLVDGYALDGIRRIAGSLLTAVQEPKNLRAREEMALGSLNGGLCLGPVNTAAVHALSYPLGSWFHVAHGHANALLLPNVLRFNLSAAAERYRDIALAMGVAGDGSAEAVADAGIRRLCDLIGGTGLEMRMSALGIREDDIPAMAKAACGITRLLKNNPRPVTVSDAEAIYMSAMEAAEVAAR